MTGTLIQAHDLAYSRICCSGVARHHQGIMTGHDMITGAGKLPELVKSSKHVGSVINNWKGCVALKIGIKMTGIAGQYHPASLCHHPDALHTHRMSAHMMHADTGRYLTVPSVKNNPSLVYVSHHLNHMIHCIGSSQKAMTHMRASRILHLEFLEVKPGSRKIIE